MLAFNFCPRKGLFPVTVVSWIPSQEAALGLAAKTPETMRIETTGQWGPCADMRRSSRQGAVLVVAVKAHDMAEVHRVLAHPREEITQKAVQAMGIVTTGQWGACKLRLQAEAKLQAVEWIDGPDKTGSNGVGDEDFDVKPSQDELVRKRRAPQLDIQEVELKQPPDPEEGTQEALPDSEEERRETPLDPAQETREVSSDRKEDTREAQSDPDEETRSRH